MSQNDKDHQQYQVPSYQHQQESQPPSFQYPSLQEQQQQQHQQALSQKQQHFQQWFAQQQQQQQRNPPTPKYPPAETSFLPSPAGHTLAFTATPGGGGFHRHAATPMGMTGGGPGAPGGIGIVGHTPMTAASFGSLGYGGPGTVRQPTVEMMNPSVVAGGFMDMGGYGGAAGLLRGNDPLQPTPVARLMGGGGGGGVFSQQQPMQEQMGMQGTPSPYNASAMPSPFLTHQHAQRQHLGQQQEQQSQQWMQQTRKLQSVKEEEDPSMLRFESRPGLDTSPMAGGQGRQAVKGGGQDRDQKKNDGTTDETGMTPPIRTPMPPAGQHRRVSSGQDPKSRAMSSGRLPQDSSRMETPSSSVGQLQRAYSSDQTQQADQTFGNPGMLQEFPFFFDGYAAWVCRHCQHVPPYYRGGNYVWQSSQPPSNQFVDMHLRFCPGLNPGNLPPPTAFQPQHQQHQQHQQLPFPPTSQESVANFPYPMPQQHPQNPFMQQVQHQMLQQEPLLKQSYRYQEEDRSPKNDERKVPDPPGQKSPIPSTRQVTDRTQGEKSGKNAESSAKAGQPQGAPHQGVHWDFPLGGRPPSFQPPYPYHPYPSHMMQMPPVVDAAAAGMQYSPSMLGLASMPTPHPTSAQDGSDLSTELSPPSSLKKSKASPSSKASPMGRHTDDATYKIAKDFLTKTTLESSRPISEGSDLGQTLVDPSDADLLTDYFFHMLQQLVVCRFSEKDRKTRGGKRENINIGYGGLQCIHCIDAPSARKFFWSTVDRLANSFAEIPSHILKCKLCPGDVRDALLVLKGRHLEQMHLLPRGSQKVFFRRVWRRLHDREGSSSTPTKSHPSFLGEERGIDPSPSADIYSPESALPAAASLLAIRARYQLAQPRELDSSDSIPEEKCERVLLAIPEDKDWLSDMDCFVRKNIEVFIAKQSDVENAAADRKYPIKVGQVGIRCIHCAMTLVGARCSAVSYPYSISGIYESVRELQRMHLETCPNVPKDTKEASVMLGSGSASLSSVLRRYYVQAARALGLFDTQDDGIGAGGKHVPMSTGEFPSPAPTAQAVANVAPGTARDDDGKRKASPSPNDDEGSSNEPGTKRLKLGDAPGS